MTPVNQQVEIWDRSRPLSQVRDFPQIRYMGSKSRLLPWIYNVLQGLEFGSALDAFSGSACVSYLLKSMGKSVVANDFLDFSHKIAKATIENTSETVTDDDLELLLGSEIKTCFIKDTFSGIFFSDSDLEFLDRVWSGLNALEGDYKKAIVISAMVRAAVKRQPRGVFTVAGDPQKYKDGRRDLCVGLEKLFVESVEQYNRVVFDNGESVLSCRTEIFDLEEVNFDLVYLDPPYVPRSDDNCYVKRYHFLEGLASYWQAEGTGILNESKVKKIPKRYTPFSYRRTATDAFEQLFKKFEASILVLSYSSNGYPDLEVLTRLMKRYKSSIEVHKKQHRYHFGTHSNVSEQRTLVREYLIVGT